MVSKRGVRTLEPGHRLNPEGIGPISANCDTPILIASHLCETPLGHRYRARQGDTPLLISTFERKLLDDGTLSARLERGLSTAVSASHPRIVGTHGFNLASVVPFAVHEDPQCTTVAQFVARRLAKARLPSIKTAIRLFDQLCEALAYLHPQSVHGLLSASTAFVDSRGQLKLFGLGEGHAALRSPNFARLVTEGLMARPGSEMGPDGRPTVATDVYLVAAFFVEVLTGRPYSDDQQLDSLLTTFSNAGTKLVRAALHRDPDERPATIDEFRGLLKKAYQSGPAGENTSRVGRVSHASVLTKVSTTQGLPEMSQPSAQKQGPGAVPTQRLGNDPSDGLEISLAAADRRGAQHDPYAGTSIGPQMRFEATPPPGGLPDGARDFDTTRPALGSKPLAPPMGLTPPPGPPPEGPPQEPSAQRAPAQSLPPLPPLPPPAPPGPLPPGPQGAYTSQEPPQQYPPQFQGPPPEQYPQPQFQIPQRAPVNHANQAVPTKIDHTDGNLSLGLGSGSLGDLALRLEDVDGTGTSEVVALEEVDLSSPMDQSAGLDRPELSHLGGGPSESARMDASELGVRLAGEDPNIRCYLAVRNDIEFGPYSLNDLRVQARDGELTSVDELLNRDVDQEFMAADHPELRPIFLRRAKTEGAQLAQDELDASLRREKLQRTMVTLRWVGLALLIFGGAGVFLWFRASGN